MDFDKFVESCKNKSIDFDGAYGCQCVDLARFYIKNYFKIYQPKAVEGAKDCFKEWKGFRCFGKEIRQVLSHNLKRGDLAIWNKTEKNKYGHIAIVLADKGNNILVFEQDGFKQDGAKIVSRSKENLLGGLRVVDLSELCHQ